MASLAPSNHTQVGEGQQPQNPSPTDEESALSKEENEKANGTDTRDPYLVDWEPNDKDDPRNWSTSFKTWCTVQLSMMALAASIGSSIIAPGESTIAAYTDVTSEATVLVVSLYM